MAVTFLTDEDLKNINDRIKEVDDENDSLGFSHSWNGTVLTINSASGSSSADLQGPKGDTGESYVLTDADKKEIATLVDVSTEVYNQLDSAKADIVTDIIAELGGLPVFGTVTEDNTIIVTSALSNGNYVLMYENEDGALTEIGNIIVGSADSDSGETDEPITGYTNQIKVSLASDGTEYVGANGEDGYSAGYRINSSGAEAEQDGMCCTGFISYMGETIRLKNVTVAGTKSPYIVQYRQDKSYHQVQALDIILTDDGNGVLTGSINDYQGYIRITCGVIDDTSILTLNEEII